ncbi:transposase [Streptomyces phyllanthi]|uniref:Transposase n=1 Tax=Streptomyces phyllanthi TaxID=1803180 RepID=A0A5N8VTG2_9ACTN|nr:transposase [Streptomyces phyllanthi]
MIDSQSVKADAVIGADSRGYDGGKQINGRKRHVVVDTLGLLLGVMVTSADAATVLPRRCCSRAWPRHTTALRWSGPTAATPAALSSIAWPPSGLCWPSSNAATTSAASWCCPSGGSSNVCAVRRLLIEWR